MNDDKLLQKLGDNVEGISSEKMVASMHHRAPWVGRALKGMSWQSRKWWWLGCLKWMKETVWVLVMTWS